MLITQVLVLGLVREAELKSVVFSACNNHKSRYQSDQGFLEKVKIVKQLPLGIHFYLLTLETCELPE